MISCLWNKFIEHSQIIISLATLGLSAIGWIVTYYLTVKAQKKQFLNNILNDARVAITQAIDSYQAWLAELSGSVYAKKAIKGIEVGTDTTVYILRQKLFKERNYLDWVYRLEEYEVLFPETANCRKQLLERHRQMMDYLCSFVNNEGNKNKVTDATGKDIDVGAYLLDQSAIFMDLRIYLQNRCLSSFTGYKIPDRKPTDPNVPKIIQDENSNLQIIEGK